MRPDILTISGHYFNFIHPEDNIFSIEDIAHGLSNTCRFAGHSKRFYSVAQHSVLVSHLVPPEFAFEGLMHDAAEAFLGDVTSPLKKLIPEYKVIEKRVEAVIFKQFGLPAEIPPVVKKGDLVALAMEKRDLMPEAVEDFSEWGVLEGVHEIPEQVVYSLSPMSAKDLFLRRYFQLTKVK